MCLQQKYNDEGVTLELTLYPLVSSADDLANSLDQYQAGQNVGPDL